MSKRDPAANRMGACKPGRRTLCSQTTGMVLLLVLTALSPGKAQVQQNYLDVITAPPDADSVISRPRPDYDAQGIPLGAFRAYPNLRLDASFDDNVLRTNSDHVSDYFFAVTPQLNLVSQWSEHFLGLGVSGTRYQYARLSSENRTDWTVAGTGRLDIFTGASLSGSVDQTWTSEPRDSRDQTGAAEPTPFEETNAHLVLSYNPSRVGLQVAGQFQRYDYGSTTLVAALGGGVLSNDNRDYNYYSIGTTALFEFSPGYAVFVRPTYEERSYDLRSAQGRNLHGYTLDAGLNLLLNAFIKGVAYVGYAKQDFQGPAFEDLSTIDYGAALRWYPSPLVTVELNASQVPAPTIIIGASLADERNVALKIDYEFRPNVIVETTVGFTDAQFQGILRHDQDFREQLAVRYLLNRYLALNARFIRVTRDSTEVLSRFSDNTVLLSIGAHL